MLVSNLGNVCENCFNNKDNEELFKNHNSIRNEQLEKYLSIVDIRIKCRHEQNGCKDILNGRNKNEHENICKYRLINCPFQGMKKCTNTVPFVEMLNHFNDHKNDFIPIQDASFEICFNPSISETCIQILSFNSDILLLKYTVDLCSCKLVYDLFYCSSEDETNLPKHIIVFIGPEEENIYMKKNTVAFQEYCNSSRKSSEIDLNAIKQIVNGTENISFKIKLDDNVSEKFVEIIECPVCNNVMKPPIFQCSVGHSICNECKMEINECPICRNRFTTTRNYLVEEISSNLNLLPKLLSKTKCTNSMCYFEHTADIVKRHEKYCRFNKQNVYVCPICQIQITQGIATHYKEYHGHTQKICDEFRPAFIENRLTYIFFDISDQSAKYMGRIIIELRSDVFPQIVKFICTSELKSNRNNLKKNITRHDDYLLLGPLYNANRFTIPKQEHISLKHNGVGTVAINMDFGIYSRQRPKFIISTEEYLHLDNDCVIIGTVLAGMTTVYTIKATHHSSITSYGQLL